MKSKEEIEELAEKKFNGKYYPISRQGFTNGYTQCQEDMADEILDEDNIKEMALDYIINTGGLPKTIEEWQNALLKFYQSLNKQD